MASNQPADNSGPPMQHRPVSLDTAKAARDIVRDAYKNHDPDDPTQEHNLIMDARRGRAVRIEVPIVSITAYRLCLQQIITECHRQLEDSSPANMKRRHAGIVLGGYQAIWRKYVAAWKRRAQ